MSILSDVIESVERLQDFRSALPPGLLFSQEDVDNINILDVDQTLNQANYEHDESIFESIATELDVSMWRSKKSISYIEYNI